jgi:serine protease
MAAGLPVRTRGLASIDTRQFMKNRSLRASRQFCVSRLPGASLAIAPLVIAALACALSAPARAREIQGTEERTAWPAAATHTDRLIVKYRSGGGAFPTVRAEASARVAANRQGVQIHPLRQMASGAQVFKLSRRMAHAEVETLAASLRAGDPNIEYAEPDRLLQPSYVPNDAMYAQQWALSDPTGGIRAPSAWDRSTGTGVVVAVIDTGVRPHADLVANLLPGYDFISDTFVSGDGDARDPDASDPGDAVAAGYCATGSAAHNSSWHGTHVAGIVAAATGNGVGVAGVAFGARVLPLRALGRCGGYTSDIADAILWAVGSTVSGLPMNTTPARVINLSLGGSGACDTTTQNAINTARAKGAVVVVAAGNDNATAANSSPANCSGVIAVAATGKGGGKASYSNFGSNVALAAPGGDSGAGIVSTLNAGTTGPGADSYASYMGTSMATPVVSGVAALVIAANKNLTPDQIVALLKSSARPFPAACSGCGTGIVDASAAVSLALGAPAPTPAPAPKPAPAPAPTPTPAPAAVTESTASNDTVATAQVIAALPSTVSGSISSNTDLDHFKVSIAGGKKLTVTLTAGASSGFGIGVFTASGQQLLLVPGVLGRTQQVAITNSGTSAAQLVIRVMRTAGSPGAYKLAMLY